MKHISTHANMEPQQDYYNPFLWGNKKCNQRNITCCQALMSSNLPSSVLTMRLNTSNLVMRAFSLSSSPARVRRNGSSSTCRNKVIQRFFMRLNTSNFVMRAFSLSSSPAPVRRKGNSSTCRNKVVQIFQCV